MDDLFEKSIQYDLIDFSPENVENEKKKPISSLTIEKEDLHDRVDTDLSLDEQRALSSWIEDNAVLLYSKDDKNKHLYSVFKKLLKKLPVHKGILYRGTSLPIDRLDEVYEAGEEIYCENPSSWTIDFSISKEYTLKNSIPIILKLIKNLDAKEIFPYVKKRENLKEYEVVSQPKSTYLITKVTKVEGDTVPYYICEVEQIKKDIKKGLYLDLSKGQLNTMGLVKKPIQVHQANGKVHTAMRWVKPKEIEGNEHQNNPATPPIENPKQHPQSSLGDTPKQDEFKSIQEDIEEFMPNEEEKDDINKILTSTGSSVEERIKAVKDYISHREDVRTEEWEEDEVSEIDEKLNSAKDLSGIMENENLHGFIKDADQIIKNNSNDWYSCFSSLKDCVHDHIKPIRATLMEDIDSSTSDTFTKNVQKAICEKVDDNFDCLGMNPKIAKYTITSLLGEDLYNDLKEQLQLSNLTINTYQGHAQDILKNGYTGMNTYHYIKMQTEGNKKLQDFALEQYEYLTEMDDKDAIENAILNLSDLYKEKYKKAKKKPEGGANFWSEVRDRYIAERDAMCLTFEDRKPCYIAFNPDGGEQGGAPEYGDGTVIQVNDAVLENCTCTDTDSFASASTIPKIYSTDHLKDLYILKCANIFLESGASSGGEFTTDTWKQCFKNCGDLPLEVQYHKSVINKKYLNLY